MIAGTRRRRRGRVAGAAPALALAAIALVLSATASPGAEDQPPETVRGRALYLQHCARCHGPAGRGDGPDRRLFEVPAADLVGSGTLRRNSDVALIRWILSGRRYRLERDAAEQNAEQRPGTAALVRFLRRLAGVDWRSADAGKRIYLSRCAGCHGWYGRPTDEPSGAEHDLGDPLFRASFTDARLAELARHRGGGRPPLDPVEATDVVTFLRLLSPGYELYQRYCVNCHGAHGRTAWLAFDESYFRKLAPGELEERVWHMLRGAAPSMPHFEGKLTEAEAASILSYLRSLPAEAPGAR